MEFTVQMLQLVHGRADEHCAPAPPLNRLQRLAEGGYVSRKQAKKLSWDYRFERVMEHRQQMWGSNAPPVPRPRQSQSRRHRTQTRHQRRRTGTTTSNCAQTARAFHMHPEELEPMRRNHDVRCATCTWTSITGPCCPSTRASTTNRWNCHANATQERFELHRICRPRRRHAPRHRADRRHLPCGKNQPHPPARRPPMARRGAELDMGLRTGANSKKTLAPESEYLGFCATRRPPPNAHATSCPIRGSWATRPTNPSNPSPGPAATTTCTTLAQKASTFRQGDA